MKYLLISTMFIVAGCNFQQPQPKIEQTEKDKATIRETYYLTTVLHDEHLFIISNQGYFIHHMDCPCFKHKTEEKIEPPKVELPTGNILDLLKGNKP